MERERERKVTDRKLHGGDAGGGFLRQHGARKHQQGSEQRRAQHGHSVTTRTTVVDKDEGDDRETEGGKWAVSGPCENIYITRQRCHMIPACRNMPADSCGYGDPFVSEALETDTVPETLT